MLPLSEFGFLGFGEVEELISNSDDQGWEVSGSDPPTIFVEHGTDPPTVSVSIRIDPTVWVPGIFVLLIKGRTIPIDPLGDVFLDCDERDVLLFLDLGDRSCMSVRMVAESCTHPDFGSDPGDSHEHCIGNQVLGWLKRQRNILRGILVLILPSLAARFCGFRQGIHLNFTPYFVDT